MNFEGSSCSEKPCLNQRCTVEPLSLGPPECTVEPLSLGPPECTVEPL